MRILIVEDDRLTAEVYSGLLTRRGHEVTVVVDGSDAFHTIHTQQFELIVLDIMLPHMDGLSMLGRIRAQPKYQSLPILIVTSAVEAAIHNKARAAGATEVIIKGEVGPEELVERIDHLLTSISPKVQAPAITALQPTPAPSEPGPLKLKMVEEPKPEKRARPVRPPWETTPAVSPPDAKP